MEVPEVPPCGLWLWRAASCELQHVLLHLSTLSSSGDILGDTRTGLSVHPCTLLLLERGREMLLLQKPASRGWEQLRQSCAGNMQPLMDHPQRVANAGAQREQIPVQS